MMTQSIENTSTDLEIKRAAQLSLAEIAIGSVGHGLKIPLTGQFLSLNQLGFLLNAINKDALPAASVFEISSIAAVLKSFSPAGQKLGPMLSIAMQGFLFWLFTALFKKRLIGQLIGAFFLAIWSFIQPMITYFLIYGTDLIQIFDFYQTRLQQDYSFLHQSIVAAVAFVLLIKLILATSLVFFSFFSKKEIIFLKEERILSLAQNSIQMSSSKTPARAALKDLTRPLFLISFVLMIAFIWQFESSLSQKIWLSLRPLASAFVLFYLLRSAWVAKKLLQFSKKSKRFEKIYLKSKKALDFVAERTSRSAEVRSRGKLE
jgi:uncharacterized membrane protein